MSEKRLIPCMLDKCRAGEFLSLKDAGLCNIDAQCASTLTARYYKGIGANHDNMVIEVITYEIPQKVRVRKHPVDCVDLCKCLRQHKETQKLTNRQIAKELNIPLTKVEHWFRQDGSFAIPDADIWFDLKNLLKIETDEFDESIMTFEEKDGVYEKGNRIYDEVGISPTVTCADVPSVLTRGMQMETIKLFDIPKEIINDNERQRRVYSTDGISPTILSRSDQCKIMEIKQIGNLWGEDTDFKNKTSGRVYDKEGISPALNTMQGGWKQPMIVDDLYNNREARIYNDASPTLRSERTGLKCIVAMPNFLEEERNICIGGMQEHQSIRKDGVVPCLTSSMGGGGGYVSMIVKETQGICTKGKTIDTASTILAGYERTNMTGFNADNGVLETCYLSEKGKKYVCDPKRGMCTDINADICQTLTAKGQSNWTGSFVSEDIDRLEKDTTIGSNEPTKIHLKNGMQITSDDDLKAYRIRKLTPRECWRLMGFTDEDFEKAAEVNSNTQLYKQAGNSIVKDVLMAIFKQMLPYEERQIDGIGKQVMVDMAVEEDGQKMPF